MRGECEVDALLLFVSDISRYPVSQIDMAAWEVEVLRVAIVRQYIALEAEPVSVVFGISFTALGEIP